jgi:hypothetical protein
MFGMRSGRRIGRIAAIGMGRGECKKRGGEGDA